MAGNILLGYWYRLYTKQTPCEELLEKNIAKLGVRYRTQHPFLAQKAFADFYFPDHNLIVEVDDPGHLKPDKIKKDLQRTKRLEAFGLKILRFTNDEVSKRMDYVVAVLAENIV